MSSSSSLQLHLTTQTQISSGDAERAISPVVVVSDPLGTSVPESPPVRADSAATPTSATLRVRTDELKRSASSPQVNASYL